MQGLEYDNQAKKNFNSIKVQLELSFYASAFRDIAEFQFHKGTIRTLMSQLKKLIIRNFNSIKVQLEQGIPKLLITASKFQFHKGTIRTSWRIVACFFSNFNSIKVQLEPVNP